MIYLHGQVLQTHGHAGRLEDGSPVAAIVEIHMQLLQVLLEREHVGHQGGGVFACQGKTVGSTSNIDHPGVVILELLSYTVPASCFNEINIYLAQYPILPF